RCVRTNGGSAVRPAVVEGVEGVDGVVRSATVAAAALGAVLWPIPFADEVALVPLLGWITARVARAHGIASRLLPLGPLTRYALTGLAARAALSSGVIFVPVVAPIANAATAAALTRAYAGRVDRACEAIARGPGRNADAARAPDFVKRSAPSV